MTKSTKIIIVLIIIAVVAILIQTNRNKSSGPSTIKIGAILPLSGDFASFGEEINRGALIATDEAKQNGLDISYLPEDDKSDAAGSVNAANKLTNIDKVDAALTATVQEVKPAASIFGQSNIPLLAVWDSNDFIKSTGPNIFTIGFSTEGAGQKMADHAYNNLNLKNIALFPVEDAWSLLIAESFQNEFEKLGGKIVLNEKLQPDQKDFRTFISKAKQAPADGIYTPLLPTQGGVFLKQSKQLSFNGKIMMGDSFGNDDLNAAGSSAEGLYITNLYTDNTKNLITKYKEKFGQDPADPVFVSFGYDGMKSLITAIQISQKQKTSVSNALRKTKLNGTDAEINFSGNQFSEKQERIYRVTNGKLEEVIK